MAITFPKLRKPAKSDSKLLDPDTAIIDDSLADSMMMPSSGSTPATSDRPALRNDSAARSESAPRSDTAPRSRRATAAFGSLHKSGFRRQVQLQLPLILVSFVLAFVFLGLDSRQANDNAVLHRLVGDALTHSQRLAKAVPSAVAGNSDGIKQMTESREQVSRAIGALKVGEDPDSGRSLGVSSNTVEAIQKLDKSWQAIAESSARLIEQRQMLQSLSQTRKLVVDKNRDMLENAQIVAAHKLQSNASAREVAAAGELVMLTQRIAKDVNQITLGATVNQEAINSLRSDLPNFKELCDSLLNGSERQRIVPISDSETKRALAELQTTFQKIYEPLAAFLKDPSRVQEAKRAEGLIFDESEALRLRLSAVQTSLRMVDSRNWNLWLAALFAIFGLVVSYLLVRGYLNESRKRAEEAEQQKGVAERLEQEAKRTNDQNQSAILRLMNELQEVADGNLTVQATVSEDITGAIADSVNYTVEELRNLVARINSTAELVNEASSKAQMIASSLQAASDQQSREIRDTGEAVLRMAQQINEVSARASESVDVARQSLGASQEGARAVQNAIVGMNGIRDQIQETAKRIKRLGESSQEVGEIVELISDITEQTNVLALNAAIQAASAGEAGRGFTVVAEEVQRLAERSGEATKQIAALIRTIQTDTQDAVAAMERSTQGVVEGTKLSDEAGRALGDIGRVSSQLAELIEGFSSTTSKQAASAGTVAQSIQRILLVTEQTSEGTLQTAGSIRQLSELAQELKSSVSRFKVV